MFDLIRNVLLDLAQLGWAHCKSGVTLLPRKLPHTVIVDPRGRPSLNLSHDVGERVRCLHSRQDMDVIPWPADASRKGAGITEDSADIRMQHLPPGVGDHPTAFFGRKHNVVMKA